MLEVNGITKYYGTYKAVDNLSFNIGKGEIFALLGLNGAGKTTTFRCILNLFSPEKGEILFNGHKISLDDSSDIGFLSEERALIQKNKVYDQVKFFAQLRGMSNELIDKKIDYWLERLNIVDYKYKQIKELSKGNQQKIQFITAIINEPKLLILDEPFTGLDPINVEMFKTIIREFKDKGASIIFSSHRMEHVEEFCEKLTILVKGRSIISGSVQEIKESAGYNNVHIRGSVDVDGIKTLNGVTKVEKLANEVVVTVSSKEYVKDLFNQIKNVDDITLFDVRLPSLNEVFVSKVGETYEQ